MAPNCSTLGMCKDSFLAKKFDEPLWVNQDKTTPENYWICEEVAKWVTTIEGMPDVIGTTFLENNVHGAALLAMQE